MDDDGTDGGTTVAWDAELDGAWAAVPDDVAARWPQLRPVPPSARDRARWTIGNPRRLGLWLGWLLVCLVATVAVDAVLPAWVAAVVGVVGAGVFAGVERRVHARLEPPAVPVRRRVLAGDLDAVPELRRARVRRARWTLRAGAVGLVMITLGCAAAGVADLVPGQRGLLVVTALAAALISGRAIGRARAGFASGERHLVELVGFTGRYGQILAVRPRRGDADAVVFTAARGRHGLVLGDLLVCDGRPEAGQLVRLWCPGATWFSRLGCDATDAEPL